MHWEGWIGGVHWEGWIDGVRPAPIILLGIISASGNKNNSWKNW